MVKEGALDDLSKDVPYDLRQIYAVEILGEHLKDVARARKTDDFPNYFKCLKDVFIVVQHKFKKKKDEKTEKTPVEIYKDLMTSVATLANKYPNIWLRKSHNEKEFAEIEQALNKVEMFLYDKIEEAKIFGASKAIPGL